MSKVIIEKDFYTTTELAKVLGISKVSVLKRIWRGNIKARKMGRNFIIFERDVNIKKLTAEIQGRLP
ncbi:MAG: helix-turn-helix domain-containing protein [Candidatus Staskawiczbacteria bacterium]|nr:helix-turn-helix domain-containing protein [Candidatus Staskawiczbacteria bacterium]